MGWRAFMDPSVLQEPAGPLLIENRSYDTILATVENVRSKMHATLDRVALCTIAVLIAHGKGRVLQ